MGRAKTPVKAEAARANGAKGGRPKSPEVIRLSSYQKILITPVTGTSGVVAWTAMDGDVEVARVPSDGLQTLKRWINSAGLTRPDKKTHGLYYR